MTQVWPLLGLAPVPTVVSMNFRPVSVVMVFPWVCAAAGRTAARVAVAITTRRVSGIGWLLLGEIHGRNMAEDWKPVQPSPEVGGTCRVDFSERLRPVECRPCRRLCSDGKPEGRRHGLL